MKKVTLFALTLIVLYGLPGVILASVKINSFDPRIVDAGGQVILKTSDAGAASAAMRVVADYGDNFYYALNILQQTRNSLTVRVPDLGKHLKIKLFVESGSQKSNPVFIKLKPVIEARRNPAAKSHRLLVGDKGEDRYPVKNIPASCGKKGEAFDHASIHFLKKRFAEAQFITLPDKNCRRCKDIRVRWYNEPTGELVYQLQIFRRVIEGLCRKNVM